MNAQAVAAALRMLADAIDTPAATVAAGPYHSDLLPPGAQSWRAVLEAGRRGELQVTRLGRRAVVTAEAWAAFVTSRGERHQRTTAPTITSGDAAAFEQLGIVVPMRRVAR